MTTLAETGSANHLRITCNGIDPLTMGNIVFPNLGCDRVIDRQGI